MIWADPSNDFKFMFRHLVLLTHYLAGHLGVTGERERVLEKTTEMNTEGNNEHEGDNRKEQINMNGTRSK